MNAVIESVDGGLKVAFRNAQAQKRHKAKNKFTGNARVVMEMGFDERFVLLQLREMCKENDINFHDELRDFRYELLKKIKNTGS